jgi:hypothetical protein
MGIGTISSWRPCWRCAAVGTVVVPRSSRGNGDRHRRCICRIWACPWWGG